MLGFLGNWKKTSSSDKDFVTVAIFCFLSYSEDTHTLLLEDHQNFQSKISNSFKVNPLPACLPACLLACLQDDASSSTLPSLRQISSTKDDLAIGKTHIKIMKGEKKNTHHVQWLTDQLTALLNKRSSITKHGCCQECHILSCISLDVLHIWLDLFSPCDPSSHLISSLVLLIQPKGSKRRNSKKREKQRSNTHHIKLHQERKKKNPISPKTQDLVSSLHFPPPPKTQHKDPLPPSRSSPSFPVPQQTFFFPNPQAIDPRANAITPQQQQQTERKQSAVARNSWKHANEEQKCAELQRMQCANGSTKRKWQEKEKEVCGWG